MKDVSCAIVSSPIAYFPFNTEDDEKCFRLKTMIFFELNNMIKQGIRRFNVAIDNGISLYAAETIDSMRKLGSEIELVCYVNIKNQPLSWAKDLRDRYFNIIASSSAIAFCGDTDDPQYSEYAAMAGAAKASSHAIIIDSNSDEFYLRPIFLYMSKLNINGTVLHPVK